MIADENLVAVRDKQQYIGGGEESFGFLPYDKVRDKDAPASICLICEIYSCAFVTLPLLSAMSARLAFGSAAFGESERALSRYSLARLTSPFFSSCTAMLLYAR